MTLEQATELLRHTLILALVISAPMLIIGLVVGILISLVQAVTQIQEQTLAFIPKIAALILVMVLFGPWMLGQLELYTTSLWTSIPDMVGP